MEAEAPKAEIDGDVLLALAVEHAPNYATAKELFIALSESLGIDKTWPAWKGLVNRNPEQRRQS